MSLSTQWYVLDIVYFLSNLLMQYQTPIGFNVSLSVESNVWQLHSGYGSPEVSSLQPGGVARQSTLFPSTQNEKGETRSGLFLFKLIQKEKGNIDAPFTILYENNPRFYVFLHLLK